MSASFQLTNPYFRLSAAPDLAKYGPKQFLRFLLQAISTKIATDLEIRGLPGTGKSTLLRYIADGALQVEEYKQALQSPYDQPDKLFPVLVEFQHLPEKKDPWAYLYQKFLSRYEKLRNSGVDLPEPDEEPKTEDDRAIDRLAELIRNLKGKEIRPVLLLDDFDLVIEGMHLDDLTQLRPLREWVSYLLVTEPRPMATTPPSAMGSPFFTDLQTYYIYLTTSEAKELVAGPARDEKDDQGKAGASSLPQEYIDVVVQNAGPFLTLLLRGGQELWDLREQFNGLDERGKGNSKRQEQIFRARLEDAFRRTFRVYWEVLSEDERAGLIKLSKKDQENPPDDVALVRLKRKGLVTLKPETAEYTIFSELFKTFLTTTTKGGEPARKPAADLTLTSMEAELYKYLRQHPNKLCSFEELGRQVWKKPMREEDMKRRLQVSISRLRAKLKEHGREDILSVRDQGYRLVPPT